MTTFEIRYMGHVVDQADFVTVDEAVAWHRKFCHDVMAGLFPNYLDGDDFDSLKDCKLAHGLYITPEDDPSETP